MTKTEEKTRVILATILESPSAAQVAMMELGRLWHDAFRLGGPEAATTAELIRDAIDGNRTPDRRAIAAAATTQATVEYIGGLKEAEHPDFLPERCRELIEATQWQIMERVGAMIISARNSVINMDEFIDQIHGQVATANASKLRLTSAAQAADLNWRMFAARRANPDQLVGVPTSIPTIDRATLGMQYGKPYVLGARPSHGKTAIAGNIADHAASRGIPVTIFAHEMEAEDHTLRMAAARAKIDYNHVLSGRLTLKCADRFQAALNDIAKLPIYICDDTGATPQQCQAAAHAMKATHGSGLIVVDYIQLERMPNNHGTRTDELALISRNWLIAIKTCKHAGLILAQLNRSAAGNRPKLHELRDSGAIEQDAHGAFLLWRAGLDQDDKPANQALLMLAKNRNGPLAIAKLHFTGFCMQFREWEKTDQELTKSEQSAAENELTRNQTIDDEGLPYEKEN